MQRFVFRLERVLQWQIKLCRIEEENVRNCQATLAEYEYRIAKLRSESVAAHKQLLGAVAMSGSELAALARYRTSAAAMGKQLETHRKSAESALAEQVGKLTDARRQLKRVEALRERSLAEYTLEFDRELEAIALESHLARRASASRDA